MKTYNTYKFIIVVLTAIFLFPFIVKSQTPEEIISALDYFNSIDSISLTITTQSTTYDINGNTLISNSAGDICYVINKPDYLKLTKQVGNNIYEQTRENSREIIKIAGNEIKNVEMKGINDLLPEPQMIFNLSEYLSTFEIKTEGENKITGVLKDDAGKKRLEIEFNGNEIVFIIIYGIRGEKETEIRINAYGEINGKKIPVSIKKTIYSQKTTVEKNIIYTITGVE
ncbi:MAG: hypothetical protein KA120_08050 [Candidatus Goldbacteria bacterium]|nr:hypothetical protein [Candidatus Goldiibacteriota bacterium]